MESTSETIYQERCRRFGAERDQLERKGRRLGNLNLLLFFSMLGLLAAALSQRSAPLALGGLACGLAFVGLYSYHGVVERARRRYADLWALNDEGLKRLRRDWAALPLRQAEGGAADSIYAADLDLFGTASLQHLVGTANTPAGRQTLRAWLLEPAPPPEVRRRQAAVAELAPVLDLRDELAQRGHNMRESEEHYHHFLRWAESTTWLVERPWLIWLARVLALVTLATLVPQLARFEIERPWLALVGVNALLTLTVGTRAHRVISQVSARQDIFRSYAQLFALVERQRFEAPLLQELRGRLGQGELSAARQMARLERIMGLANLRFSMFDFPIQLLTLWSIHVLWWLERWQRDSGAQARAWLAALGELEALAALATLRHDHPGWVFPELVEDGPPTFEASCLGHPLLRPDRRVDNDVSIGPPGTFLLVTGSNMSGKSTLLRSIGLNVVLAQAGAPVAAQALRLSPLRLATSMRVQDSLELGISYFMAELKRLKEVVDMAAQTRQEGSRTLLFLLDEILHGTNTGERQIAARRIIRHLLALKAIGAVSTHDLTLADSPDFVGVAWPVHFTEDFRRTPEGLTMEFDYTLRPGLATSTNALKLMEMVGLPAE